MRDWRFVRRLTMGATVGAGFGCAVAFMEKQWVLGAILFGLSVAMAAAFARDYWRKKP